MIDLLYTRPRIAILAAGLLALAACTDPTGSTGGENSLVTQDAPRETGESPGEGSDTAEMMTEPVTGTMVETIAETPAGTMADPTSPTTAAAASFLALSDVHLRSDGSQCSGDRCQTSPAFWTATQARARSLVAGESPDFVIYLGDMPAHSMSDARARETVLASALDGLAAIVSGTTAPIFYLPGNNDTLERNPSRGDYDYCPFTYNQQTVFDTEHPSKPWPVINGGAVTLDDRYMADGYYRARLTVGASATPLRIIALNTNIFTTDYSGCSSAAAAAGSAQLDWLADELAAAAAADEPVLLAMHVPPGIDGYGGHPMWSPTLAYAGTDTTLTGRRMQDVFLTIIARHPAVITNIVSGHTHLNGIRRLHSCDTPRTVTELIVSVPGISSDHGNSAGMKLFTLDAALEPVDITTYGAIYRAPPVDDYTWTGELSYDFRTNYPNTTPAGTSLLDQITSLSDEMSWEGMWGHLYVEDRGAPPPHNSDYRTAMDVSCAN